MEKGKPKKRSRSKSGGGKRKTDQNELKLTLEQVQTNITIRVKSPTNSNSNSQVNNIGDLAGLVTLQNEPKSTNRKKERRPSADRPSSYMRSVKDDRIGQLNEQSEETLGQMNTFSGDITDKVQFASNLDG